MCRHRGKELLFVYWVRILQSVSALAVSVTPLLTSVCTFAVYTYTQDTPLQAADAFAAISVFNLLRLPLILLPRLTQTIAEVKVACHRLADLLVEEDVASSDSYTPTTELKGALDMSGFEYRRVPDQTSPTMTLSKFSISPGEMVTVVGPVGSGKSFLLACMLGEVYNSQIHNGTNELPTCAPRFWSSHSKISFVAQSSWILNMTLKQNILFGRPYDKKKYDETIIACALADDLSSTLNLSDLLFVYCFM